MFSVCYLSGAMFHLRSMFAYWFYLWMINKHYVDDHWGNGIFTAAAKSLQLCPTLFDPIDGSPPGSPIPGILQARTLEWVTISFSNAWKWKVKGKLLSHVRLIATPWTAAHQAPPSMGFSRQEYWSGCHCLLRMGYLSPIKLLYCCQFSLFRSVNFALYI